MDENFLFGNENPRHGHRVLLFRSIMRNPIVVVNFKTYESSQGISAEKLAMIMQGIDTSARLVAAVSSFDLDAVVKAAPKIEVWCQHLDPIDYGSNTGFLHPLTAIERGASGTLINHAEHKVDENHVSKLMEIVPNEFVVCACAADIAEAELLCSFNPSFVAVEPPELIGGDVSVTNVDPAIVSGTADAVKSISDVGVLCGAGVKTGRDVIKAIELGASGVLLASGVTKSDDPEAALMDLVSLIH